MQIRERLAVTPAKMLLFAAATGIYCMSAVVIASYTDALLFSMTVALLPAIGYVAAGGIAIHLAETIRRWSFPATYRPWNEDQRFILGIIWPAVLVFWLTVGTFNHFAAPNGTSSRA